MNTNEISINDEKKSRHYLKSSFEEKTFFFSRYDGSYARRIQLGASGVIENIDGKGNPNESFWEFENNELVFLDSNRNLTSRYFCTKDKANGLYLLGYYEPNKEIIFKLQEIIISGLRKFKELKFYRNVVIFDNVLFLHQENSAQRQFQTLMGEISVGKENLVNFKKNIEHNKETAKRNNFDYKHIVFPAKPNIYKDQFKAIGVNLKALFTEDFMNSHVMYPQLTPEDYYLCDTHINDTGNFKVIKEVLKSFNYPDLPEPIFINDEKVGDLMQMMGKDDHENILVIDGFEGLSCQTQEFSLSSSIVGNTGQIKILFNPAALYNRRLVLFGDSFVEHGLMIYSKLFCEVIYLRKPYIINDIVNILEPDIVLTSNTERYLCGVPNLYNDKPWFINYIDRDFDSSLLSEKDRSAFKAIFYGKQSNEYKNYFGSLLNDRQDSIIS